jgi:hypothetical protein
MFDSLITVQCVLCVVCLGDGGVVAARQECRLLLHVRRVGRPQVGDPYLLKSVSLYA